MSDRLTLVLLGTGASAPSPLRGLPGVAVVRDASIILIDCGEGTQMRLSEAKLSPNRIETILISHLHGDHIYGLPGFLSSQQLMRREKRLRLIGPPGLESFVQCVQTHTATPLHYPLEIEEIDPGEATPLDLNPFQLTVGALEHSVTCLGFRLSESSKPGPFDVDKANTLGIPPGPLRGQLQQGESVTLEDGTRVTPDEILGPEIPGRQIAYCSDTRPCDRTVELARGCDCLLHDSTFDDTHRDRAIETGHSTAAEAARIALQAGVRSLYLYHISNRIVSDTETSLLQQARAIFPDSYLPHDLDSIPVQRRTA
jgi:ribonuclease Z